MAEFVSTSSPASTLTHPERALNAVIRVTASDVRGSKHLLLLRWCEQKKAPGTLRVCVYLWPNCGNRDGILVETSQWIRWKESRHIRAVQRERERVQRRRGRGERPPVWMKVLPTSRGAGAPRRCPVPLMVSASELLITAKEEECGYPIVGSVLDLLFTCCCVMSPWMICVRLCSDLISLISGCLMQQGECLKSFLFLFSTTPSDDRSSATSGLDVADRLTYLEQRMQMQEDEIQLLKMALADVLKRLNISEEHQAAAATATSRRPAGTKGEQLFVCSSTYLMYE